MAVRTWEWFTESHELCDRNHWSHEGEWMLLWKKEAIHIRVFLHPLAQNRFHLVAVPVEHINQVQLMYKHPTSFLNLRQEL